MLDLKNYTTVMDDITVGETRRVNHSTCEAGADERRRLYLTRTVADPTKVVAYCHNCQQGGVWTDRDYKAYRNQRHQSPTSTVLSCDEVVVPPGLVDKVVQWPAPAQAWRYKKGPSKKMCEQYGIQYDPSSERVYLPRYAQWDMRGRSNTPLIGYQLRSLNGVGSKYLTVHKDGEPGYTKLLDTAYCQHDYAIIVEDLCSGLHILESCSKDESNGPMVFVNYGTKVDPTMMYTIANNFKWCVVWLDNDGQHIHNQAQLMVRTIKMYSNDINVKALDWMDDAKYHEADHVVHALDEVWTNG